MRKVIISLAPVEALVPVDKEILAEDVVRSVKAGAAICHLHCRKPDGTLTPDLTELSDTFERIVTKTDVVIQASTGGVSDMTIEERCRPLQWSLEHKRHDVHICSRVESASLNGGSTNLGEAVYVNSLKDIRYCAGEVYKRRIIPEIEVFDIGMIYNIKMTEAQVLYRKPLLFNLVFGHKGGMQADMKCLTAFHQAVPVDALWGVTHYGRDNWAFLAAAIAFGASIVRIGFEDSRYLSSGEMAKDNCELVKKLVQLIYAMDLEPATPTEAREILGCLK